MTSPPPASSYRSQHDGDPCTRVDPKQTNAQSAWPLNHAVPALSAYAYQKASSSVLADMAEALAAADTVDLLRGAKS